MNRQSWYCAVAVVVATALGSASNVRAALLLNYKLDEISPDPAQTTPDASGNFGSVTGSVNAVLGHGGANIPTIITNPLLLPVQNVAAGVQSRNSDKGMNFPGNAGATGINSNVERVEIAAASAGALNDTFTNFTVSMWLYPTSTVADRFAIGKMGGTGQRGWQIASTNTTQDLSVDYFDTASGSDRSLKVVGALPLDQWTHVTFVFEGDSDGVGLLDTGTEAIYLNNVLVPSGSVTNTGALTIIPATFNGANSANFRVGHRGATGSTVGAWAGGIDDVMIFNESLAWTPTGSLTGTGSLLIPEPSTAITVWMMGTAIAFAGYRSRRIQAGRS